MIPNTHPEYRLRQYEDSDRGFYWKLFYEVFMTGSKLDDLRTAALPDGFFVIEHKASGYVVASAVAAEYDRVGHAERGSLQWVMTDPAHTGKGLGSVVAAAATRLLTNTGYRRVYLSTDDWRLPAISIYLKLGWKPLIFTNGMAERWNVVLNKLGKPEAVTEFVVELR